MDQHNVPDKRKIARWPIDQLAKVMNSRGLVFDYPVVYRIFKQLSAVSILKGRWLWRVRKCLFSVTSTSAPVHSVYAAIKASCCFNPCNSYLTPNSKGISISSSIDVTEVINPINSLNPSGVRLFFISSTIMRGSRIVCAGKMANILSNRSSQERFFGRPMAKMYSLESRTSCKFFLPDSLSILAQFLYYFFSSHMRKGRFTFSNYFSKFLQVPFCLGNIRFHFLSPLVANIQYTVGEVKTKENLGTVPVAVKGQFPSGTDPNALAQSP